MNRQDYRNEVKIANLKLKLAQAKFAYFEYLFGDCDLYSHACHIIVNNLQVPAKMNVDEAEGCKKHIDRITKIESLINKM
jgi:hypothetical protein